MKLLNRQKKKNDVAMYILSFVIEMIICTFHPCTTTTTTTTLRAGPTTITRITPYWAETNDKKKSRNTTTSDNNVIIMSVLCGKLFAVSDNCVVHELESFRNTRSMRSLNWTSKKEHFDLGKIRTISIKK